MSTLTDFLLARIAEDEEAATGWRGQLPVHNANVNGLLSSHDGFMVDPTRVLAECAAKRRIVELRPHSSDYDRFSLVAWGDCHEMALQALALPYAGHPDYREEWRP